MKEFHFTFIQKPGQLPLKQPLTIQHIWEDGSADLTPSVPATIDISVNWLTASPVTASTPFISQIGLTTIVKTMPPGNYGTDLSVTAPVVSNSPQIAHVTLEVKRRK